jgi:hypothetical protein
VYGIPRHYCGVLRMSQPDFALAYADYANAQIVGNIKHALSQGGQHPVDLTFSSESQQFLRRAWELAVQVWSREVGPQHVIASLAYQDQLTAEALRNVADCDSSPLLLGALVHVTKLKTADRAPVIEGLMPSRPLQGWIEQARKLAGSTPVTPAHFIDVLGQSGTDDTDSQSLPRLLSQARSSGELLKSRRWIDSNLQTVSRLRGLSEAGFERLNEKIDALNAAAAQQQEFVGANVASALTQIQALVTQTIGDIDKTAKATDQKLVTAAATTDGLINGNVKLHDKVMRIDKSLGDWGSRVALLNGQMIQVRAELPRPPTALRLGAMIGGALTFGTMAGLLLNPANLAMVRSYLGI